MEEAATSSEDKVGYEVVHFLFDKQIKHLKSEGLWFVPGIATRWLAKKYLSYPIVLTMDTSHKHQVKYTIPHRPAEFEMIKNDYTTTIKGLPATDEGSDDDMGGLLRPNNNKRVHLDSESEPDSDSD